MSRCSAIALWALASLLIGTAVLAAAPEQGDGFELGQLVRPGAGEAEMQAADEQRRVTLVTGDWVDVREVLKTVAESSGYGLQIAPDVAGTVNVHLENVSLNAALRSLLEPIDLGYELVEDVLMVYKRGLVTRWFNFDYLVMKREGRGELRISGYTSSSVEGGQSGSNQSQVTSSVEMAVWPELIASLKTLVFAGATSDEGGGEEESGGSSASMSDSEGRSLVVSPMAGVVQVTAEWRRVRQVELLLEELRDALRRQVAVEVKIIEVNLDDEHRTGIDWSVFYENDGLGIRGGLETVEGLTNPVFKFIVEGKSVTAMMEMVEKQGKVTVVSTPRITTLNNQKAIVRIVTEEVFYEAQVQPAIVTTGVVTEPVIAYVPMIIPVGLVLDVTPQVGDDNVVTLNVHPTISSVLRVEESPNKDTAPVLAVRELDTVGKVMDGETLVIAGLLADGLNNTESGVPFLMDIPFLGYLFKRKVVEKQKIELVMLLTPVVLDAERNADWVKEAVQSIQGKM